MYYFALLTPSWVRLFLLEGRFRFEADKIARYTIFDIEDIATEALRRFLASKGRTLDELDGRIQLPTSVERKSLKDRAQANTSTTRTVLFLNQNIAPSGGQVGMSTRAALGEILTRKMESALDDAYESIALNHALEDGLDQLEFRVNHSTEHGAVSLAILCPTTSVVRPEPSSARDGLGRRVLSERDFDNKLKICHLLWMDALTIKTARELTSIDGDVALKARNARISINRLLVKIRQG
jgi:hypothetical protein